MTGTLPAKSDVADRGTHQVLNADVFEAEALDAEALDAEALDAEGGEQAPIPVEVFRQGADRCAGEEMKPLLIFVDSRPLTRASIAQFLDSSVPGLDVVAVSGLEELLGGETHEIGALALVVLNIGPLEITEDIIRADIRLLKSTLPEIPLIVMSECDDARYVVEA
ncbi:MAG: response regulator transcription factor, partial [Rhodospirillales bacterium]|nr:response regulator transcription factor [Rhodospirillales bacterium]